MAVDLPKAGEKVRKKGLYRFATNQEESPKKFFLNLKKKWEWRLAPAYDLCFSFDPTNHWVNKQTLSVNGKRLDITKEDLLTIAKDNNLKRGKSILEEINAVVKSWKTYAQQAGVRKDLEERIHGNLNVI
ncbi:MAG: hypothetical protein AB3N10_10915 [Allomuricauda sp.]